MTSTHEKFEALRALDLPIGQYVVTSSGPMGVRGIREIDDIDLMVDDELWIQLVDRYGISEDGTRTEVIEGIEAFREESFPRDPTVPSVADQIAHADMIDGLPFARLDDVIALKQAKGRPKDKQDIALIVAWRDGNESTGSSESASEQT
jgi:hypothetical protein